MRRLDGSVGFFQGRADLGFTGLFQLFLGMDPLLRLVGRRLRHGLLLTRTARDQRTGNDNEEPILDFHHYLYVTAKVFGRMQTGDPPTRQHLPSATGARYTFEVSQAMNASRSALTDFMARRTTNASSIFPKIGTESGITSKGETK